MYYLVRNNDRGTFIKIGNTPEYIFEQAKKEMPADYPRAIRSTIDGIWLLETTLRKLSQKEFLELKQHGYWTARATFEAWTSSALYAA